MKPEARLDSAVFQLTPTRTRCDLVITAHGKKEKIASGLLNPFLAHLKTAQHQIAKGGYSITLEPDPQKDSPWFTKGTMERFVRFVNTPEVLERVSTIESEISQIEEAISVQGNENHGLITVDDYHQTRPTECIEGCNTTLDADEERAIVLYKPGSHPDPPDLNGCTMPEKNSKVQLLRVLETRKTMLQKEQGMAFARAAAADFDMDHMTHLVSFAECFGASRLMEACLRYMELWKRKHETGQWFEVDPIEAISSRSEFTSLNASSITLSGDTRKQIEFGEAGPRFDLGAESNGKSINHVNAELSSQHLNSDHSRDQRQPLDPQVPLGPHEYSHLQSQHPTFPHWPMHGPPMYQPYPMQGTPYYQSYPVNTPFFQPPYLLVEDPRFTNREKMLRKRHSMGSKDMSFESETSEMGVSCARSQDDVGHTIPECEKEVPQGRESRKSHGTSESESESASLSETKVKRENKESSGSSKRKVGHKKSMETSNLYAKDEVVYGQEADSGNWQAFQSFLLRAEEKTSPMKGDIFAGEKTSPIASRARQVALRDECLISREGRGLADGQLDSQFNGIRCGGGYKKTTDESFIVPFRSGVQGQFTVDGRAAIEMDSELPLSLRSEKLSSMVRNQLNYEPEDLTLMTEREVGNESNGYDLARYYDSQVQVGGASNLEGSKDVSRKSGNEKRLKVPPSGLLKKNKDTVVRRGAPSKLNPLTEAQRRAEKVRAFKADLQKEKKEKEEEEIRRLEALKRERQRRIAARSSSGAAQSQSTPKQNRSPLPTKVSPSSYKGSSKFSDSEPGSSSPLPKLPNRTSSIGLTRSLSSLPELKKESNSLTSIRNKRLSDPKGTNIRHASSLKPASRDQVPKKKLPEDSQMKISAIMQLDKTKSATLPELKTKPSRAPSEVQKSISKETQTGTRSETSLISESKQAKNNNEKPRRFSNIQDPIIEKTVVMVGTETVPAPTFHTSEEIVEAKFRSDGDAGRDRAQFGYEFEAIRAPPSRNIASKVDYSSESKLVEQLNSSTVLISKDEARRSSKTSMTHKHYQTSSHARATSLEDLFTSSLASEETATTKGNFRVRGPGTADSVSLEQVREVDEKLRSKESKGFRKLLKFRRG